MGRRKDPARTTNVELGWLPLVALVVGVFVVLLIGFFAEHAPKKIFSNRFSMALGRMRRNRVSLGETALRMYW